MRHGGRGNGCHRQPTPDTGPGEHPSRGGREVLGEKARVVADDGASLRLSGLAEVVRDRLAQAPHVSERVGVRDPRAPPGRAELDRIERCDRTAFGLWAHRCPRLRSIIGRGATNGAVGAERR